ncbi:bifunctional methylenetetrahydrofolate dehydrogenase/methenyltetrahydrofolate cyclohydrolase [Patescibacteria group bacterium]|nr:bifunctional methylenetetrahydrofolate dehydrogenase/methenyltetrahydrofolate cyclohydrolase [Patescibacteria group bacterium]MBU1683571.1 bifunctional methylenetetrahydrofolate dehydrogenase/methenyltetrahydrofolate cyclohydrolase [Patescibacteria group bacterium]MBU1934925.1 bifunctional methylenetetrahydrofolate dehydrogenase/methenyltetrahydrofolate cyclohydrolase [Patescibacteria group bacterium]
MTILDGKALSEELIDSVKEKASNLKPTLAVILVGENPASLAYVKNKKKACEKTGIEYIEYKYPATITQEELLKKIEEVNQDDNVNGLIVQLPLPDHIYVPEVIKAVAPKKDVDGFHAYNIGKMFLSPEFEDLPPATPFGIVKLLDHYDIPIEGKDVVVVGHSNIVGKPISMMMLNRNATVTTCHIYTKDLAAHTKNADILIVAVGKEKLITADMVKDGAVVVDVGMNRREDGSLCGDVDFDEVSKKASYITPVPGGVGPMTVAALILNTIRATERQNQP